MSVNLHWRLCDAKRVGCDGAKQHNALRRLFGDFPIKLCPHDEYRLRAMAATEEIEDNAYKRIADLLFQYRNIELFVT